MNSEVVSIERIKAQLDSLRDQEADTIHQLRLPESVPGTHVKLVQLLYRITQDRDRLTAVIDESLALGRTELYRSELLAPRFLRIHRTEA
jgi:hypothetical protein